MNLTSDDVVLFGDNYFKDIEGANKFNILTYWVNENNLQFINFKNIYYKFKNLYDDLIKLKNLSKYCGERFDLVQAGGGNISVKSYNLMFIKASGINLTNVDENNGYVTINNDLLINDINSNNICENIIKYNYIGNKRGSIPEYSL